LAKKREAPPRGGKESGEIARELEKLAGEILEISEGLGDCGEAIACEACSSKLAAAAAALRQAAQRMR
jgi:hypothetical protein